MIKMREWSSNLSLIFFLLSGVVGAMTLLQVILLPFRFRIEPPVGTADVVSSFKPVQVESLAAYEQQFLTHALFYKPQITQSAKKIDLVERLRPYTLVGIVQGVEPEALIQNSRTNQIHFVQAGEQLDELKLVDMKAHSVVLEYDGEKRELHMEGGV